MDAVRHTRVARTVVAQARDESPLARLGQGREDTFVIGSFIFREPERCINVYDALHEKGRLRCASSTRGQVGGWREGQFSLRSGLQKFGRHCVG